MGQRHKLIPRTSLHGQTKLTKDKRCNSCYQMQQRRLDKLWVSILKALDPDTEGDNLENREISHLHNKERRDAAVYLNK